MFVNDKEMIIVGPVRKTGNWHPLAEAIREGCVRVPRQAFQTLRYYDDKGKVLAACAIGAAELAGYRNALGPRFGEIDCPACGEGWKLKGCCEGDVTIPHLNDDHRWTREAIADWLDTL